MSPPHRCRSANEFAFDSTRGIASTMESTQALMQLNKLKADVGKVEVENIDDISTSDNRSDRIRAVPS
jgi:hypothetical protein